MKIESRLTKVSGVLTPCFKDWPDGIKSSYKLQSDTETFYLSLNPDQEIYADSIVWDKIEVIGKICQKTKRLIVTRFNRYEIWDSFLEGMNELSIGSYEFEEKIKKVGKIEIEDDLVAS